MKLLAIAFCIWFLILSPSETHAMTKKEFKDWAEQSIPLASHPTKKGRKTRRAYLTDPNQCVLGLNTDNDALLIGVNNHSLKNAGLKLGDKILEINDVDFGTLKPDSATTFLEQVSKIHVRKGDVVSVLFDRDDQRLTANFSCQISREEWLSWFDPLSSAIFKDRPKECLSILEDFKFRPDSPLSDAYINVFGNCLARGMLKGRLTQQQYNLASFQLFDQSLDYWNFRYLQGGISKSDILQLTAKTTSPTIQYLQENGSSELAHRLSAKYTNWRAQVDGTRDELLAKRKKAEHEWIEDALTAINSYSDNNSGTDLLVALEQPRVKKRRFETEDEFKKRVSAFTQDSWVVTFAENTPGSAWFLPNEAQIFIPVTHRSMKILHELQSTKTISGQNSYGAKCEQTVSSLIDLTAKFSNRKYRRNKYYVGLPRNYLVDLDPEIVEVTILRVNPSDPTSIVTETIGAEPTCRKSGWKTVKTEIQAEVVYQAFVDKKSMEILAIIAPDLMRFYNPREKAFKNLKTFSTSYAEKVDL